MELGREFEEHRDHLRRVAHRVLAPDVVLRVDTGAGVHVVRGAEAVAGQAASYRSADQVRRRVLVDGRPGALGTVGGRPVALLAFTVDDGRITGIDILADPARLGLLASLP